MLFLLFGRNLSHILEKRPQSNRQYDRRGETERCAENTRVYGFIVVCSLRVFAEFMVLGFIQSPLLRLSPFSCIYAWPHIGASIR